MKSKFTSSFFQLNKKIKLAYKVNFTKADLEKTNLPLIVFNYGLVCSNTHFSKQIPYFNERGYPILLHDYRGHFKSTGSKNLSDCNFATYTSDLQKLILHTTDNKHPVAMVGHSMGVNITLEYLKNFPNQLQKMVLISGTIIPPQDTMFDSEIMELVFPLLKFAEKKFPHIFEILWKTSNISPITQWIVLINGFNHKTVPISFVVEYLRKINILGPKLFLKLFDEMNHHNIISDLNDIKTPALIIGGEKDKIIPNYFQKLIIKKIPHSEFYLLKDGSHVPQVDYPDLINERIDLFLKK